MLIPLVSVVPDARCCLQARTGTAEAHRENPVPEPCGSQGHLELSVGWVSPRVAVDQWLNSPGHRENLFRPQWRTVGIGILRGADFDRFDHGVIWVNQFGDG